VVNSRTAKEGMTDNPWRGRPSKRRDIPIRLMQPLPVNGLVRGVLAKGDRRPGES